MSIVISTPTGRIGARLTDKLLAAGETLVLISRHPEKIAHFAARGATVVRGDLRDEAFVLEATRGAKSFFTLVPPNPGATDFRAYQRGLGWNFAKAVEVNRIPRVVNLSSVGAQLGAGVGPVNGLHDVEQMLNRTPANVTHLRPCAFMENIFLSLETLKSAGAIFEPVAGDLKMPLIATRDIADVAARVLMDPAWSGKRVLTLYGPAEYSGADAAEMLSRLLERPIQHVQTTPEQTRAAMLGMGLSENLADLYLELYDAFADGRMLSGLPAEPNLRTSTRYEEFLRDTLRPLLA